MVANLIVGNWKMNNDFVAAIHLTQQIGVLARQADTAGVVLVVTPPTCDLRSVSSVIEADRLPVKIGAQHAYWEDGGAFTGETSIPMVKRLGCSFIIVGHSERRELFGMDDEAVAKTTTSALRHDLTPIVCVGESEEIRAVEGHVVFVTAQIRAAVGGLTPAQRRDVVVAYEPVWAIGTGKVATPEQVAEMIAVIRDAWPDAGQDVTVLYGGSVKPENAAELASTPGVDGFLVGGASLNAEHFVEIAVAAAKCYR
jgi:triosephosphate isomerase